MKESKVLVPNAGKVFGDENGKMIERVASEFLNTLVNTGSSYAAAYVGIGLIQLHILAKMIEAGVPGANLAALENFIIDNQLQERKLGIVKQGEETGKVILFPGSRTLQ